MADESGAAQEILNELLQNTERCIEIIIEKEQNIEWTKDLTNLPLFTKREIELHRKKSGKNERSIIKTRDQGLKFKNEGYVIKDEMYTKTSSLFFTVKAQCRSSMIQERKHLEVVLNRLDGEVFSGTCDCAAGNSSYCNHVMALLFELADFSLRDIKTIPEDIACTSGPRQWGTHPSDKLKYPEAVRDISIRKGNSRGISSTLYNPRINTKNDNLVHRAAKAHLNLLGQDQRIGYAHTMNFALGTTPTTYGDFFTGSPLSYQLGVFEQNFMVITNLAGIKYPVERSEVIEDILLPINVIGTESSYFPKDWGLLNYSELSTLSKIFPETVEKCRELEQKTMGQASNEAWHQARENRITSSSCHKVFIRKRNFETLVNDFCGIKKPISNFLKDLFAFGRKYEPVAREKFEKYMSYTLKRKIKIRETGIVVQPFLFWLAASPDGLIIDQNEDSPGLIEIKCPKTKRNSTPDMLLKDDTFYVGKDENGFGYIFGYYSQIQLAMGLSQISYCYFVVYTFKGLIIVRTEFDEPYFLNLVTKLNKFYKQYLLKHL